MLTKKVNTCRGLTAEGLLLIYGVMQNDDRRRLIYSKILSPVAAVYDALLETHGTTHNGVGWHQPEIQIDAIHSLLEIINNETTDQLSINDFGCGFGTLFELIKDKPWMDKGHYYGYDINENMIMVLLERFKGDPRVTVEQSLQPLWDADYSFASGTFNISLGVPKEEWLEMIQGSLEWLWEKSRKGVAVNFLNSNWPNQNPDLVYFEPDELMGICSKMFTENCELCISPSLLFFSILMRK